MALEDVRLERRVARGAFGLPSTGRNHHRPSPTEESSRYAHPPGQPLPLAAAGALACSEGTAPAAGVPVSLSFSAASSVDASLSRRTIPEGSYTSLEAKLRPVRSGSGRGRGTAAFLAAHPDLAGVSVLVEGTWNGVPFTYRGAAERSIERGFSPPLAATGAPVGLTVNADLATWFRTSSGTLIDPRTANAGGANVRLVESNIERSFRAFRADDHDGREDR